MFRFFKKSQKDPLARIVKKGKGSATVICVDDNHIILSSMLAYAREQLPKADVLGFENVEDALAMAREIGCDILLTEIELRGTPAGLVLARGIQEINPRVNVIFTTVCSQHEYAAEVMDIRPSGYLTKVVTREALQDALSHLLYAVAGA